MFREIFHLVVFSFCTILFFIVAIKTKKELTKSSNSKDKIKFAGLIGLVLVNLICAIEALYNLCK